MLFYEKGEIMHQKFFFVKLRSQTISHSKYQGDPAGF